MTTPECVGFTYLRTNLMLFKHSRIFINGLKMMHNLILGLSTLIMENNTHQMNLKTIFTNMGSNIKQLCLVIPDRTV